MGTETVEAVETTTATQHGATQDPKREPTASAPGATDVFPWVVEQPLGRGGQGTTWRARHRDTGQLVALKRFKLREATDWKAFDLFEREARTLASLSHPGIPRFVATGGDRESGELWLAMELVEGEALALDQPRKQAVIEDIALQVLEILDYLHRLSPPVIHRDVKPRNLVRRPDGRVMLIDFGSVRTALASEGGSTLVGTFGYLAPEQLHGAATPATDLYSLGMTLAALSAGEDATALPRNGLALDCARVFPEGRLRDAVQAMTAPDPAARPSSAAAARAILRPSEARTARAEPLSTGPASPPPRAEAEPEVPEGPDEPAREARPKGLIATIVTFIIWLVFASTGFVLRLVEHIVARAHASDMRRRLAEESKVTERARRKREALSARQARERENLAKTRERFTRIADRFSPLQGPPRGTRRGGRDR